MSQQLLPFPSTTTIKECWRLSLPSLTKVHPKLKIWLIEVKLRSPHNISGISQQNINFLLAIYNNICKLCELEWGFILKMYFLFCQNLLIKYQPQNGQKRCILNIRHDNLSRNEHVCNEQFCYYGASWGPGGKPSTSECLPSLSRF